MWRLEKVVPGDIYAGLQSRAGSQALSHLKAGASCYELMEVLLATGNCEQTLEIQSLDSRKGLKWKPEETWGKPVLFELLKRMS